MMKNRLALALKIIVSVGLLWAVFLTIDVGKTRDILIHADPGLVALAAALFFVQLVICVCRWSVVLKALEVVLPFLLAFQIYYIGAFFNQALPSSVGGDAVRMYRTYQAGKSLAGSINSVMLERAATVLALVILVIAVLPFMLPRVDAEAGLIGLTAGLTLVVAVAGLAFLMVLDRLPASLHRWRAVRGLALLAADTRRVFLSPITAVKALGWSLVGHLNLTFGVFLLAMSLDLEVTWIDCIALIPPVLLITALPISIGGWGVRETAMVVAFKLIDVPKEEATALSLLMGALVIVTSLPGGFLWWKSGGSRGELAKGAGVVDAASAGGDGSRD